MLKVLLARLQQGHRTMKYPDGPPPTLSDRFRGRPAIDAAKCPEGCRACADACPTNAVSLTDKTRIDLGRCLFCTDCVTACPDQAITYTNDHRLAVRHRADLTLDQDDQALKLAHALDAKLLKLF